MSVRDPDPAHVDTASVVVIVSDVNDNAPVFSRPNFSRNLSESDPVDTSVAKFTATDKDPENNGKFSYVEFLLLSTLQSSYRKLCKCVIALVRFNCGIKC